MISELRALGFFDRFQSENKVFDCQAVNVEELLPNEVWLSHRSIILGVCHQLDRNSAEARIMRPNMKLGF
jgi:hypothetical protein